MLDKKNTSEFLNLEQACLFLGISLPTGRNWLKLGKLAKDREDEKGFVFSASSLAELKELIKSGSVEILRSRRNKTALKARDFFVNYIPSASVNRSPIRAVSEHYRDSTERAVINVVLAQGALSLLSSRGFINRGRRDNLIRDFLEGHLNCGEYDAVIRELFGKNSQNTLLKAANNLPDFTLEYIEGEDTLGYLYIMMSRAVNLHDAARYYPSSSLVEQTLSGLKLDAEKNYFDPLCGTGAFLVKLVSGGIPAEHIFGCDTDALSCALCRVNISLASNCTDIKLLRKNIVQRDVLSSARLPKFQVAVGNPLWNSCEDDQAARSYAPFVECSRYGRLYYADMYLERTLKAVDDNGTVSFVLPESMLTVASHARLRDIISEFSRTKAISYVSESFNNAQSRAIIWTLMKTTDESSIGAVKVHDGSRSYLVSASRSGQFNFKVDDLEYALLNKIENAPNAVYLKDNADFALGIVTGGNQGVLYDHPVKGTEGVIRGVDIDKYLIKDPMRFLRFDPENLQQVAPVQYYRAPEKLIYRFIARYPVVALDEERRLTLNSCNIVVPHIEGVLPGYVLAVLNSSVIRYYFERKFQTLKILRSQLEQVPIPNVPGAIQREIRSSVLSLRYCPGDRKDLVIENIDKKICNCFGLTDKDREYILSSFKG